MTRHVHVLLFTGSASSYAERQTLAGLRHFLDDIMPCLWWDGCARQNGCQFYGGGWWELHFVCGTANWQFRCLQVHSGT